MGMLNAYSFVCQIDRSGNRVRTSKFDSGFLEHPRFDQGQCIAMAVNVKSLQELEHVLRTHSKVSSRKSVLTTLETKEEYE